MGVKASLLPVLLLQGRQCDAESEQVALRDGLHCSQAVPSSLLSSPPPSPSGTHLCWNSHSDLSEALEEKSFALRYNRNLGRVSAK